MIAFISWYLIISLLGWLTFPLVYALFPALTDKGYTLSRAAGLLIWGYAFWLLASFGVAQNDTGGILFALVVIIVLSAWSVTVHYSSIVDFLKSNKSLVITGEILFLVAFAFLAFVRSANPELASTEKPMELAFINGILRSPTFPPRDPWLSGYAISYYYFGYVMTAMLARLSGIPGTMAHNLMTALIFGLGAIGSYGILYNLLAMADRRPKTEDDESSAHHPHLHRTQVQVSSTVHALLAPLFLLLVSNFEALLEVLHRLGLFWSENSAFWNWLKNIDSSKLIWRPSVTTFNFWTWLDMKELSNPPTPPFTYMPDRYLWWWRASRVIQDYDMVNSPREVIDEFPFFSFLLGDLHPHVLAIPFGLLAIAVALNLFLGGWRGKIEFWGARLHINYAGFLFSALVVGGLAFLNTWDILVAAALIVGAYVFWRASEDGWRWSRLEDLLLLGLPLGILSIVLYFPFYLGFSSQAGGILPNMMYPTRGAHLWVMWGTLFIPIFAYLIHLSSSRPQPSEDSSKPNWKFALLFGISFVLLLWAFSWLVGWIGSKVEKDFVDMFLQSQKMSAGEFFSATSLRRLMYIGSLITLLAIFIPALALLFQTTSTTDDGLQTIDDGPRSTVRGQNASQFLLLLLTLGAILVIVPEFIYLRDQFGYRINTIFKFYYQAWILWSLVAAFAVAYLLRNLKGATDIAFRVTMALVIFAGLLYPSLSLITKTNGFNPPYGFTLDDFDRATRENPDEAAAIQFLRTVPDGVIAEAVGDGYSSYARISMHTGLPTVLGWPGHESQWRGSSDPQGSRRSNITTLYTTTHWEEAQPIIERYGIRYIYIGLLERSSMPVREEKFQAHLKPIFQQGSVAIYAVP
jgi:YYY domain-containing protein